MNSCENSFLIPDFLEVKQAFIMLICVQVFIFMFKKLSIAMINTHNPLCFFLIFSSLSEDRAVEFQGQGLQ